MDDLLDKGIKLNWNKSLGLVISGMGRTSWLTNNTSVTHGSVANGGTGHDCMVTKTPTEILYDVNTTT